MQTTVKQKAKAATVTARMYDLNAYPQPEVVRLRAEAERIRIDGAELAGQFKCPNAEVNLDEVARLASEQMLRAKRILEQVARFQGAA